MRRLKDEMETSLSELEAKLRSTEFRLRLEDEDTEEKARDEWCKRQQEKCRKLQAELDSMIYDYFGLNDQEIALVEDTCEISDRSDTPGSLDAAARIPTQQPVHDAAGLTPYAEMLANTLNGWASGPLRVSATGGVDTELGLALVELTQTGSARPFEAKVIGKELATALQRLQQASSEESGHLAYLRGTWHFNGPRIHVVKPALLGQWTRTAALNDAADLYAYIAEARGS